MRLTKIGRYHIRRQVGRGATATVFRAFDPHFQRIVALKLLPANLLNDVGVRARFEREAHTVAALEHPAIVPVYDFGEEDGRLFFVMRFMDGGSLADRLHKRPLSLAAASAIFNRLAPALDEAHQQGVIHRDLKPGNILFDRRNLPYLADFGIVKLSQEGITTLTTAGGLVGTPAYMSPEQVRGQEKLDGRSDIYALGVILFQMLTAHLPFNAETPLGVAVQHVTAPVPHIFDFKNDLPAGCQAIIARAMAKDREERYQTATEMAKALARLAETLAAGEDGKEGDGPSLLAQGAAGEHGEEEEVPGLYAEAVAAMEAERWDEAIEKLNAILAISPVYRDTVTRLAEANRRRRSAELLAQARAALDAGAWDEAQARAAQILSTEPNHGEAAALQEEAATGKQLARLYRQAAGAHESEAWDEAVELLEQIVAVDDGYRDAQRLLKEAEAGRRAHVLFEEAQAHAEAEEWEEALEKARAALALRPGDEGYQALAEAAHAAAGKKATDAAPREETAPQPAAAPPLWRQPHVMLAIVMAVLLGSLGLGYAALGTPPAETTPTPFATWAFTPGPGTAAPAAGDGPAPTPTASRTPSRTATTTATPIPTATSSNTPPPSATAAPLLFPTATSPPPAPSPTTAGEESQPPPQPTNTPVPPTNTPPPTNTRRPPTNTPPPPTNTPPPTATRPPPTSTPGPPTRGPTPTPP